MSKSDFDLTSVSPLWLVPVAIVSAAVLGSLFGRGTFFLTLAGFALLGTVWVLWQSVQSLTGDAPLTLEEALGLGAPSAEEERKAAVLRALKDLEYERAVGKIDEQDFQKLSEKYRKEAKALLALLDDDLAPARELAEKQLRERLTTELAEKSGGGEASADSPDPSSSAPSDSGSADSGQADAAPADAAPAEVGRKAVAAVDAKGEQK